MRIFEQFSYQGLVSFAKRNKVIAFFQNVLQTKSNNRSCFLFSLATIAGSEKCNKGISSTLWISILFLNSNRQLLSKKKFEANIRPEKMKSQTAKLKLDYLGM